MNHTPEEQDHGEPPSRASCIYCNTRTLDRCMQCGRFMCRACVQEETCGDCEWREYVRTAAHQESATMSSPEEQDHAELEPTHAPTCDCDACEPAIDGIAQTWTGPDAGFAYYTSDGERFCNADDAATHAGEIADALHDRASRTHGHLREQLRAAAKVFALALACLMPGHADAREQFPMPAYLTPPANCALYLSFEDHSSLAYCETDGMIGYDADGPTTGWHLLAWAHTTAR